MSFFMTMRGVEMEHFSTEMLMRLEQIGMRISIPALAEFDRKIVKTRIVSYAAFPNMQQELGIQNMRLLCTTVTPLKWKD